VDNVSGCARDSHSKNIPKGTGREVFESKRRGRLISTAVTLVIIFSLIVLGVCYSEGYFAGSNSTSNGNGNNPNGNSNLNNSVSKAALIDALYSNYPNDEFTKSVNNTVQEAGLRLDVFQGAEVTVDFLEKLSSGYKLIILRMHSAMSDRNELYLFTAEPYAVGEYTQEQDFQLIKEAYASASSQPVFAVDWGFIERLVTGRFNGTLVVAMGCNGADDPFLAKEFINQGAIGYIGWNGLVSLSHSDMATLYLVQALYLNKLSPKQAVDKANAEAGEDPDLGSILKYCTP
jgi:hypothetical protein